MILAIMANVIESVSISKNSATVCIMHMILQDLEWLWLCNVESNESSVAHRHRTDTLHHGVLRSPNGNF
jgi:hypothetical protein